MFLSARSSHDTSSARAGNAKFSSLAAEKQLSYHPKKSCYLVFGSEMYKATVNMETDEEPIMLGKVKLTEKTEEKYLGDVLSSLGLAESVEATVKERLSMHEHFSLYEWGQLSKKEFSDNIMAFGNCDVFGLLGG